MGGLVDDLLALLKAMILLALELLYLLNDRRQPITLLNGVITDSVYNILHKLGPLHALIAVDVNLGKQLVATVD